MYLIRDEDENVLNGIDFTPEKKAIKSFIEYLLKSKQEEIERAIEKQKKDDSQIKGDIIEDTKEVLNGYLIRGGNQALEDLKPIITNILK